MSDGYERPDERPRMFLSRGAHPNGLNEGSCAMELAAWLAGEPHTDQPRSVSLLICNLMKIMNDALDDVDRQRLLPYCIRVIGTNTRDADEERRGRLVLNWLADTFPSAGWRWFQLPAYGYSTAMWANQQLIGFTAVIPGASLIRDGIFKLLDDLIAVGDRTVVECEIEPVVPERVEVYRAALAATVAATEGR